MKLWSLIVAVGLGLAGSVSAQYQQQQQQQQQQPTDEQQQPTNQKAKDSAQTAEQSVGPVTGHSDREAVKDTSKPARMKSGASTTSEKTESGPAVQTTSVFRNGKQTSERLSLHRGTRVRTDAHFSIGTHPRDWWLRTYSIVLISGCHYYLADDGCWYPAYGFDPSCNFPDGVVYCD
jgi:hypothetical protein